MIIDWVTKSNITLTRNTMDLFLNQMNPSHLTFMLHFNFILSPMSKFFQLFLLPFGFSDNNYIHTSHFLPPPPTQAFYMTNSSHLP